MHPANCTLQDGVECIVHWYVCLDIRIHFRLFWNPLKQWKEHVTPCNQACVELPPELLINSSPDSTPSAVHSPLARPSISPSRLLYMVASAESTTQHPIASAIVRMLRTIQSASTSEEATWVSEFAKETHPRKKALVGSVINRAAPNYVLDSLSGAFSLPVYKTAHI
ncbi:unnamed protein product [Dibothriocephalus latus]|uniref:Uncharacterized protein n=1 Tax=Dibothriocephalus latus TaxID=60516 RepID=A0A3P7NYF7_DIBLA|nr:unnamed protein product [Dibothriocephalus latus]